MKETRTEQQLEIIFRFCLNLLTVQTDGRFDWWLRLVIWLSSGSVATEEANITHRALREGNTNTKNCLQTLFDILRLLCVQKEASEVLPASGKD